MIFYGIPKTHDILQSFEIHDILRGFENHDILQRF